MRTAKRAPRNRAPKAQTATATVRPTGPVLAEAPRAASNHAETATTHQRGYPGEPGPGANLRRHRWCLPPGHARRGREAAGVAGAAQEDAQARQARGGYVMTLLELFNAAR